MMKSTTGVRLWKGDDAVDISIACEDYNRLLEWASRNNIQVYIIH